METPEEPKTKACVVLSCRVDCRVTRLEKKKGQFALVELLIPFCLCGKCLQEVANGFLIWEITCLSTRWETGVWV